MLQILIAGGGPAGAAAAIAARLEGREVQLFERATTPRHKVCGEFLSPGVARALQALGAWPAFESLAPKIIRRCAIHLGSRTIRWNLAEPAFGLSRLALDRLLLEHAQTLGAQVQRGAIAPPEALIVAYGRTAPPTAGERLFGFKSHFEGPANDAVDLFFDRGSYAGVSGIEDGLTNVCALAPESLLKRFDFDFDTVLRRIPALAERMAPLRRHMPWLVTGPLSFRFTPVRETATYPAGDALGFVDPFTGTGILNALVSGRLAGIAAARGTPPREYLRQCHAMLARPFWFASLMRRVVARPDLHWLASCVPGRLLFGLTRLRAS